MILNLFAECISRPSEAPHPHPHRKILPFDIACTYVLWVGVATNYLHIAANANGARIASVWLFGCAVNLLELRIVNFCAECLFYCVQINPVTVCGDLNASLYASRAVVHKLASPPSVTTANQISNA